MLTRLRAYLTSARLEWRQQPQLGEFYAYKRDAFTEMLGALYAWETLRERASTADEQERYELDERVSQARARFASKLMIAAVVADRSDPFDRPPESYTYRQMLNLCRKDLHIR